MVNDSLSSCLAQSVDDISVANSTPTQIKKGNLSRVADLDCKTIAPNLNVSFGAESTLLPLSLVLKEMRMLPAIYEGSPAEPLERIGSPVPQQPEATPLIPDVGEKRDLVVACHHFKL